MIRAIVFANGVMDGWPVGLTLSPDRDLIIAADGGLAHCRQWGVTPHVVVGDMDSIDPGELTALEKTATEIIRHPARKDETDLELALKLAKGRNADDIIVLGALGARWDMSLANVLLLSANDFNATTLRILDGPTELRCLKGGEEISLAAHPGDRISLLPLAGDAVGITLEGLEYPLKDARLPAGSSRGVSNVFIHETARVSLASGILLITITRSSDRILSGTS